MTVINKTKVTMINRGLTSIFLVICFLLSLIQSQQTYAEMKKVTGTFKTISPMAQNHVRLIDAPVKGLMNVYRSVLSSADSDWNNARIFYIEYNESIKEWGDRGYGVITHQGGDQTFIKFVSRSLPATGSDASGEWDGVFIGGTGKFKAIKARWLLKWKNTMAEGTVVEWKVEPF